tara:strand:+ start:64644 stop:64775 length:132 start_codon:yes stop_codon:yes gene_type:complete
MILRFFSHLQRRNRQNFVEANKNFFNFQWFAYFDKRIFFQKGI